MRKKLEGFSLIEVLIVVTILAIIFIVVLLVIGNQQPKARDSKRLSDISFIVNYLEKHKSEEGDYPTSGNYLLLKEYLGTTYLARLASLDDPSRNRNYIYRYDSINSGYCLCAHLENDVEANADENCNIGGSIKTHYCRVNIQ